MIRIIKLFVLSAVATAPVVGCNKHHDTSTGSAARDARASVNVVIYASYGEAVKPDGQATPAATVLGDLPAYEGKPVRVAGTVSKVCERKGCWLEMTDGGRELFVKFTCPIDGRLIPMEAIGKSAIVEGQLAIKEIPEADPRHLAEEGGKTPEQVAKIIGPQKQVTLKSAGGIVFGITK